MQPALLAADADEYSVTRSLEAYLLWLFGYIMFNNTHGNSVDRILLPYAREIADGDEDVPPYSWGEAVLAATYRGLCDGCMVNFRLSFRHSTRVNLPMKLLFDNTIAVENRGQNADMVRTA